MTLLANAYSLLTLVLGWLSCASVAQETAQASGEPYLLQDIVTWDAQSIRIHGERVMIFSAEVHPFRYTPAARTESAECRTNKGNSCNNTDSYHLFDLEQTTLPVTLA